MNYTIITYVLYLVITIALTIWVARTLFKNVKVFIIDIFHGNKVLADRVNNLLLVFYLINIGYALYTLHITNHIQTRNRTDFKKPLGNSRASLCFGISVCISRS